MQLVERVSRVLQQFCNRKSRYYVTASSTTSDYGKDVMVRVGQEVLLV